MRQITFTREKNGLSPGPLRQWRHMVDGFHEAWLTIVDKPLQRSI
jgi:hypothetical protein